MPPAVRGHEIRSILMRKRVVKVALRFCALLALTGVLAVGAVAGGGIEPDPNGPGMTVVGQ